MKLGIVIPLKAKQVAKDWPTTCKNLERTVSSVLNQSASNFQAIIVGHDCPDFMQTISDNTRTKIHFLKFDLFPPPQISDDEPENQIKYEADRCSKILLGIKHLKNSAPSITHWFPLDADDLVRNDLVHHISKNDDQDAYILDKGFFYFENSGIINKENEFSAYCGSSAIISDNYIKLPSEIDKNSFREIPFGEISHVHMKSHLISRELNVMVPNERLIMYVRDNGENISNAAYCNTNFKRLKKYVKIRLRSFKPTPNLKRSFSLT